MQSLDFVVSSDIEETPRVKQISAMFDAPLRNKLEHRWQANLPLDEKEWSIGLIVGPSGCGKTLTAINLFGADKITEKLQWKNKSVIDDFEKKIINHGYH